MLFLVVYVRDGDLSVLEIGCAPDFQGQVIFFYVLKLVGESIGTVNS